MDLPLSANPRQRLVGLLRTLAPPLATRLLADGDLPPAARDEAADLLRRELADLVAFIPYPLVQQQLAYPQPGHISGAYWQGSVLFADLSGFTALSSTLSVLGKQGAEEISAIVNQLFGGLVRDVHVYRGALLKFGGDALTAFFDAAVLGESHAAMAAVAALAMQQRMDDFAALETRAGTFRLRLRVGVHSGRIFAGQVGEASHIELVVTGPNINRVALAQEIAEPGEVVVSSDTHKLLAALNPQGQEREHGFRLLSALPLVVPPPPRPPLLDGRRSYDLAALAHLAGQVEALRPYLLYELPRRFMEQGSGGAGEFRPVSVLFANFYPFSSILDMLEDDTATAAQVLNAYYRRAQAVVHSYGGVVNKVDMYTFGDKLMALFGAPVAHEDDPARAVRAALALRSALDEANTEIAGLLGDRAHFAFSQRVGINTGQVFAGRVGSPERYEYSVMGPAVNLAARLMSSAQEGQVLLSPSTRRAVERSIAVETQPPLNLKGISEPVTPALALRAYEVDRTGGPDGALARPPLVAREAELVRCIAQSRVALAGAGRVLALVGDAGTGKTRMIEELVGSLARASLHSEGGVPPFALASADCQSYEQRTPYATARPLLRDIFQLSVPADPTEERLLRWVQALAPHLERFAPLLGDLFGHPIPDTPLTAGLTPEQRHDRVQELVEALVAATTARQPLVLVIDDLHWADASSRELIDRLAHLAAPLPLLLVLCYRPDPHLNALWDALPATTRLQLQELPPESSQALASALLGGPLPAELAPVLERTQGNPFFIEELIRSLVATGTLVRASTGGWQLTSPLSAVALPDSIEGVLTARLDRLDEPDRDLVQLASVVGRRFLQTVLQGLHPHPDQLGNDLRRLCEADIFQVEDADAAYFFRHTLVRDVAYEGILYARRRELHGRVAQRIATLHGPTSPDQTALLARHFLLAEDWPAAFRYHLIAGRQAQGRFANAEALALFAQALQISPHVRPEPSANDVVELHERSGVLCTLIGDYDQALERFRSALNYLAAHPDPSTEGIVRLHRHIATTYERQANFDAAFDWLERGMAQASGGAPAELTRCYLLGAGIYLRLGNYQHCIDWARMGRSLAERLRNQREQAKADKLLGGAYYNQGDYGRAIEFSERSLSLFIDVSDIQEQAGVYMNLGNVQHELGRWQEARASYEASARLAAAIGNTHEQAFVANNLGDVLRSLGDFDGAIQQFQIALAGLRKSLYGSGVAAMNLGASYLLRGDLNLAQQELERSDKLFAEAGTDSFLPELLRYQAELSLARGDPVAAAAICRNALERAAQLGARLEEGTARRVLGQALAMQGDLPVAHTELLASEAICIEAGSRYELARTHLQLADVEARLGQHTIAAERITGALAALSDLGARHDIAVAEQIAAQYRLLRQDS